MPMLDEDEYRQVLMAHVLLPGETLEERFAPFLAEYKRIMMASAIKRRVARTAHKGGQEYQR